jgi:hypothetical protein
MDWRGGNILHSPVRISVGTAAIMTEVFRGFPPSLQENSELIMWHVTAATNTHATIEKSSILKN